MITPWGDADALRERKLSPGPGVAAEAVAKSQRERLFAAMVAEASERGYAAISVANLIERSGVSRTAFYAQFRDKEDCFLATVEAIVSVSSQVFLQGGENGEGAADGLARLEGFLALVAAQPAAARLCFVETFAAGPAAIAQINRATDGFEELVHRTLAARPGETGIPRWLTRSLAQGLTKVIHTRLHRREEDWLAALAPELWQWALSYRSPPALLRRAGRRGGGAEVAAPTAYGSRGRAERIIDAATQTIAERGYQATTIAQIAQAAHVSVRTFGSHFDGKADVMAAAFDRGQARMLAAALPAARRAKSWPEAVRAAIYAMLAYLAGDPEFARLGLVEVYSAGAAILERRDRTIETLQELLGPGYELAPQLTPVTGEGIGGAIYAMLYDQVHAHGAGSIEAIAPLSTFIALAPFLGAEEACVVAGGERAKASGPRG